MNELLPSRVTIIVDGADGSQTIYLRLTGDVSTEVEHYNPGSILECLDTGFSSHPTKFTLTVENLIMNNGSAYYYEIHNNPIVPPKKPLTDEEILNEAKRVVKETKARLKK